MELKPINIPFSNIFPNLTSSLWNKEKAKSNFRFTGIIDQSTPYGQAHKGGMAIERRISQLHLIMHKIRCNLGVNILPKDKNTMDFLYLSMEIEQFFIWIKVIFDLISYLTPLFYDNQIITGEKRDRFSKQLNWFLKSTINIDDEYKRYLSSNIMSWFTQLSFFRDDPIHRQFWAYTEMKNRNSILIKRMRGNKLINEYPIPETIGYFYVKFSSFSDFYEKHFRLILLKQDKDYEYHTSNPLMVTDYYQSLQFFVNKASKSL